MRDAASSSGRIGQSLSPGLGQSLSPGHGRGLHAVWQLAPRSAAAAAEPGGSHHRCVGARYLSLV